MLYILNPGDMQDVVSTTRSTAAEIGLKEALQRDPCARLYRTDGNMIWRWESDHKAWFSQDDYAADFAPIKVLDAARVYKAQDQRIGHTKNMKEIHLKRSQAAELIEDIREAVSVFDAAKDGGNLAGFLLRVKGILANDTGFSARPGIESLSPCYGQAHSPEVGGMQDNCSICAPRWAWVGPKIVVR